MKLHPRIRLFGLWYAGVLMGTTPHGSLDWILGGFSGFLIFCMPLRFFAGPPERMEEPNWQTFRDYTLARQRLFAGAGAEPQIQPPPGGDSGARSATPVEARPEFDRPRHVFPTTPS